MTDPRSQPPAHRVLASDFMAVVEIARILNENGWTEIDDSLHEWVDPGNAAYDDALVGAGPVGPEDKPIVYLFSNARSGDGVAYMMAESGHILASHFCSHAGYMKHDLHDRRENGKPARDHYPDGYRLCVLPAGESPPSEVYERNQALRPDPDPAA